MYRKDLIVLFVGIFILGVVVFAGIDYVTTLQHETVHQQINTYFGCDNVSINMNLFGTSTTSCNDENRSVSKDEWALHAINEVITYNNAQLSLTLFFCTIMILVFVFALYAYTFTLE